MDDNTPHSTGTGSNMGQIKHLLPVGNDPSCQRGPVVASPPHKHHPAPPEPKSQHHHPSDKIVVDTVGNMLSNRNETKGGTGWKMASHAHLLVILVRSTY